MCAHGVGIPITGRSRLPPLPACQLKQIYYTLHLRAEPRQRLVLVARKAAAASWDHGSQAADSGRDILWQTNKK